MSKTLGVRMDRNNYEFVREITKEEGRDFSKAVRDMVIRGRILLAVEKYKKGEASLVSAHAHNKTDAPRVSGDWFAKTYSLKPFEPAGTTQVAKG